MGVCSSFSCKVSKRKNLKKVFFNKEICNIFTSLNKQIRKKVFIGLRNRKFLNSYSFFLSKILDCKSSLFFKMNNMIENNIQFSEVLFKTNLTKLCVLKMDLSSRNLGNNGLELLSMALAKLKNLSILFLDLKENNIQDKGCEILINTIKEMKNLQVIWINLNNNMISNETCWRLKSTISKLSQIKYYTINHENNSARCLSIRNSLPNDINTYKSILNNDINYSTVDLL